MDTASPASPHYVPKVGIFQEKIKNSSISCHARSRCDIDSRQKCPCAAQIIVHIPKGQKRYNFRKQAACSISKDTCQFHGFTINFESEYILAFHRGACCFLYLLGHSQILDLCSHAQSAILHVLIFMHVHAELRM